MTITYVLSGLQPFANGETRLCFVHPDDPTKMIKVLHPDAPPADRRAKQRPFKRWVFCDAHYDANFREINRYAYLYRKYKTIPNLVPFYETVETDLGVGMVTQLLRDFDGRISKTLYQCKKYPEFYKNKYLLDALEQLHQKENTAVMFNTISVTNVVVQILAATRYKVWIVDGIINSTFIPISDYIPIVASKRKKRKLDYLKKFIEESGC